MRGGIWMEGTGAGGKVARVWVRVRESGQGRHLVFLLEVALVDGGALRVVLRLLGELAHGLGRVEGLLGGGEGRVRREGCGGRRMGRVGVVRLCHVPCPPSNKTTNEVHPASFPMP